MHELNAPTRYHRSTIALRTPSWPFCHREPIDHGVELKVHMLHGGR